jgi:hypothetical protein
MAIARGCIVKVGGAIPGDEVVTKLNTISCRATHRINNTAACMQQEYNITDNFFWWADLYVTCAATIKSSYDIIKSDLGVCPSMHRARK